MEKSVFYFNNCPDVELPVGIDNLLHGPIVYSSNSLNCNLLSTEENVIIPY
jgi:hypothetical protein